MSKPQQNSPKNGLPFELTQLALAAGLCFVSAASFAQDVTLKEVTVTETATAPVKVDVAPSAKFTAPLLDTPKTVQVINEEMLQQTGATNLQEALRLTPGITFGNGEGSNPTGDQPFMRGMDVQNSTFVDGMRDIAAGAREVFNLESVEVIKGADSAYAGRGGAGGSINLTTKKAKNENFISGDVGLGTDNYKRATLDLNRVLSEGVGFRLNAMAHDADVPGRNGPDNQRWGIAPTVTLGMDGPTQLTLSLQHLHADAMPDGGVPYLYSNGANAALTTNATNLPGGSVVRPTYGNSRDNWYGLVNRDHQTEKSDLFTVSLEHKFSDTNKFRNSLRYSKSKQDYIWTQPDDSKGNVVNGFVYRRGNSRLSNVTTLQNVSEFTGKVNASGLEHSFAVGMELSKEKSDVRTASGLSLSGNAFVCRSVSTWCASLNNPDSNAAWTASTPWGEASTRNSIDTVALYAFDTVKLNEQWFINGGLRADHYKVRARTTTYDISKNETLLNYQLGVVFKPATNGSIYASYGTASKPGGGSLGNGNEDQAITTDALAELDPEKTRSYELGTKWDLLDKKLGLTAALFRNEVTNVRITENSIVYMGGNKVVNGVELGFTGQVMPGLSVFGGYTFMDSEQKNAGAGNVANGRPFANTPKHSFSLWTTYKPTQKLTLGLGVYAQSSVNQGYAISKVDGGIVTKGASGYTRVDAMVAYQIDRNLTLQLNAYNLGDKAYYNGIRSPHYANIAAGRSAVASLKFSY